MMAARTPSHSKPISWPNQETLITSTKIVANLACYFLKSSLAKTAAINFSLRCISVYQTPSSNRYYRLSLEIGAFLVLPLPYGILFSIGVDAISEAVNFYNRHRKGSSAGRPKGAPSSRPLVSPLKLLDPTKEENALKILGLQPEDIKNPNKIDSQYQTTIDDLIKKQANQAMIDDVNTAYQTLTSAKNEK